MVAGYESAALASELINDYRIIDEVCELDEGGDGYRTGHGFTNQSPHTIDVRAFSVITPTGQTLTSTYEPEELAVAPEYGLVPSCEAEEESPFGTDYKESWITYYDPTSDKLIESLHLLWDDDYEGTYAQVRTTATNQGAAAAHTTQLVKTGESLTVNFAPANGYRLTNVESSCGGSLQGNAFTVAQVNSDCLLEPVFEPVLVAGETFRLSLEEPVAGSVYSGVGNLRGWSVASIGVDRIEVWMDGVYTFDAPLRWFQE
jgi:hypothetical protein